MEGSFAEGRGEAFRSVLVGLTQHDQTQPGGRGKAPEPRASHRTSHRTCEAAATPARHPPGQSLPVPGGWRPRGKGQAVTTRACWISPRQSETSRLRGSSRASTGRTGARQEVRVRPTCRQETGARRRGEGPRRSHTAGVGGQPLGLVARWGGDGQVTSSTICFSSLLWAPPPSALSS